MNQIVFHKLVDISKSRGFLSTTKTISVEEQLAYFLLTDCIGAIDGTHIKANIPLEQQRRFWNRKGFLSQNVMATCTFDMQFTYVLAGWEGSAADLRSMLYANLPGFLAPYRGTRYHLQEFGDNVPRNDKEFSISNIENASPFTFEIQTKIVIAYCINNDQDSNDSDGLVEDDSQIKNIWRERALQPVGASHYRDTLATHMWNDY
ncbi:uncharacterized protein [Aristolochia californica]|uniref:uncharacterized protein n=1 Tax=Aristolochia californica TaxID=171875 RepID=UPI0035DDAE02